MGTPHVRDLLVRGALGSTAASRELVDLDARLRRPVSTSRRLGVVAAGGGAGATTVTLGMAGLLAARRHGGVLAVDAAAGPAGLVTASGVTGPLTLERAAAGTSPSATCAQARASMPTTPGGVAVLGTGSGTVDPVHPDAWRAAVDPVGRFFDVVITDWGVRADEGGLDAMARDQHAVAVVARADRATAEAGLALAARLRSRTAAVVLALVDVGGTGGPTPALARRALAAGGLDVPVLAVPHGRAAHAAGVTVPAGVWAAWARVAVALLEAADGRELATGTGTVAG